MRNSFFLLLAISAFVACCNDDNPSCPNCEDPIITGAYNPQPYQLVVPAHMSQPYIPADNPLTVAGVELGRRLFYDPILSADSTMGCFSCHLQEKAFTDGRDFSLGILGIPTPRSAMSLVNLTYMSNHFFWDGRSGSLEEQALLPVEAHDELNDDWENVEKKLRRHPDYPTRFRAAFGIEKQSEITRDLAVKAIAQFQRTLISANSRYDKVVWNLEGELTEEEERGLFLFQIEPAGTLDHPGCSHCHGEPFMTDNSFRNNGLDDIADLNDFTDKGRGAVTGSRFDNGKFRVPTLRNIELTAPYMHDGRFATLEEVLDHYAAGGHGVLNEDTNIAPFTLTPADKAAMLAFLRTLTDTSFVNNPAFSNPF